VISFSEHRMGLTMYHLKWDMVDEKYRALTRLLDDHLAQGVWQCCRYPGWTNDDHRHLTPLNLFLKT
jgi:hypothetical protein